MPPKERAEQKPNFKYNRDNKPRDTYKKEQKEPLSINSFTRHKPAYPLGFYRYRFKHKQD